MLVATWNLNSLNVRLGHLLDWLATQKPDIVCLQETKLEDHKFPQEELAQAGYQAFYSGQKTYNGVALLARQATIGQVSDVQIGNPHYTEDVQKRLIAATLHLEHAKTPVRVICAYVPNGQEVGSEKYDYKLTWLNKLFDWVQAELDSHPNLILAGDFNIAPADNDVHDPQLWAGKILCSQAERSAYQRLLSLGLQDSFRLFEQPEKTFSWWDYRMLGFQKNSGMRIDYVLASDALSKNCTEAYIDRAPRKLPRPSDHAPVLAKFSDTLSDN